MSDVDAEAAGGEGPSRATIKARKKVDFISGSAPDENGRWFDEAGKEEGGTFWWRKHAREAVEIMVEENRALSAERDALKAKLDTQEGK